MKCAIKGLEEPPLGLAFVVLLGLLPGLAYFAAMIAGLAFGNLVPARFLVEKLLQPMWAELLFYGLVLGGCALSAVLSLGPAEDQRTRRSAARALGWVAVVLLLVNLPMSMFQLHRLLARSL
jgi:hypothetical protein